MTLFRQLEKEIEIKAQLFAEGVRVEDDALEGIPEIYAGYPAITPFTHWQRPRRPGIWWPDHLILPLGTKYKVFCNYDSPFLIRRDRDALAIEKNGVFISSCRWGRRPADFEDARLPDGTRVGNVVTLIGGCMFTVQIQMICPNWVTEEQCRYCDVYHPEKAFQLVEILRESGKPSVGFGGTPEQVAEAAAIAEALGYHLHYLFLGGFSPKANDFLPYIAAIRRRTGREKLRGSLTIGAPKNLSQIDRLAELGLTGMYMDMEVWHPGMFEYICPGKARRVGRERWLEALEYAGRIFQPGNTATSYVCGLESKKEYLEAAKWFSEKGILLFCCAFQPMWGTPLEGHRPPCWQWQLDVNYAIHDVLDGYLPTGTDDFFDAGVATCYNCNLYSLLWDIVRLRRGGSTSMNEKGTLIHIASRDNAPQPGCQPGDPQALADVRIEPSRGDSS